MNNKDLILLVEDDPDAVDLTLRAIRKSNIKSEVVVASDGVEALDYLFATGIYEGRDQNIMPRVVLLDLKLPRIGGLEVLRRIRSERITRYIPVVIFTASTQEVDLLEGYRGGANSYVKKPVDFDRYIETVNRLGTYWLFVNEPPPSWAQGRSSP